MKLRKRMQIKTQTDKHEEPNDYERPRQWHSKTETIQKQHGKHSKDRESKIRTAWACNQHQQDSQRHFPILIPWVFRCVFKRFGAFRSALDIRSPQVQVGKHEKQWEQGRTAWPYHQQEQNWQEFPMTFQFAFMLVPFVFTWLGAFENFWISDLLGLGKNPTPNPMGTKWENWERICKPHVYTICLPLRVW